jgi:uncharacterized protein YbdZ (MbtH family)
VASFRVHPAAGWRTAYYPRGRTERIDIVTETWVDMRPKSLVEAMREKAAPQS